MEAMRTKFIAGAVKLGHAKSVAEQVFAYIDRFANYGFNRSHAVAYSKMAFEMAYLKCHYPAAFFTALFGSETNVNKLRRHFDEAKEAGVQIQGPHVNFSRSTYQLDEQGRIVCGFSMIKGLRKDFAQAIVKERADHGPFKDLRDFINRLDSKWQKEDLIRPLIYVGAFDHLGFNRHEMIAALPALIKGVQLSSGLELFKDDPSFQTVIESQQEYPLTDRLNQEYEYLGLYLSGHPTSSFKGLAQAIHSTSIDSLQTGRQATILVFITNVKEIHTKRDHRLMAFIDASDASGTIEMTAFPRTYQQFLPLLTIHSVVVVQGKVENRDGRGLQLVVNRVGDARKLNNAFSPAIGHWFLRIDDNHDQPAVLRQLARTFREHHGQQPVILVYTKTDSKILQPKSRALAKGEATKAALVKILGAGNVAFKLDHQGN